MAVILNAFRFSGARTAWKACEQSLPTFRPGNWYEPGLPMSNTFILYFAYVILFPSPVFARASDGLYDSIKELKKSILDFIKLHNGKEAKTCKWAAIPKRLAADRQKRVSNNSYRPLN